MFTLLAVLSKLPRRLREAIMPDMLIPPISNSPDKVQLVRPAHVYFEHPDLEEFVEFARDFGLVEAARRGGTIYFRGYGKDPYVYVATESKDGQPKFNGPAFVAANQEEFEKTLKIPGAIPSSLENTPGGGRMATFERSDNTKFHVVYGQAEEDARGAPLSATHEEQGPFNGPFQKPRLGMLN